MRRAVIFDIDGTLADCDHRRHHVQGSKKDWAAFYAGMEADQGRPNVIGLLRHLSTIRCAILVTGRPETYRNVTKIWLNQHGCDGWGALFMRKDGDFRADTEIKKEIYHTHIEPTFDIDLVVDDRTSVVQMWRNLGLECWQVANGDF